jgi:hypothetical protein
MLYSATTSVLQWGLDFGYEVSNMNPMLGLEDAAALGIIGIAALVEGGIWVWGALANNKIPEAPSKLKNGDKVKTPESHKNEWSRNRDGSYTHGKTGWNAKQDRSGHGGPHWDMKPPRGSGHINVGSNGNIFGGSR